MFSVTHPGIKITASLDCQVTHFVNILLTLHTQIRYTGSVTLLLQNLSDSNVHFRGPKTSLFGVRMFKMERSDAKATTPFKPPLNCVLTEGNGS